MRANEGCVKTWTSAVQRRAPDNIVSSDYTSAKVFVPSYEKEIPRMEQLLTNDYQRIWWKEKHMWDKMLAEKSRGKRILPRMLIKKKVPSCVTVKYQTQTERWKGKKKKQNPKSNAKKKETGRESKTEKSKSAENGDGKLEEDEGTKLEKHEEAQSENEKGEDEKVEEKNAVAVESA